MRRRSLHDGSPAAAGLSEAALRRAVERLRRGCDEGEVGAVALLVARRGLIAVREVIGQQSEGERARRLQPDDLFLVASLTKPLVCLAVLSLLEEGRLRLDAPVRDYLPEVDAKGADAIRVRHLLTHTSGLPDMVPEDDELRARQAPLAEFVAAAANCPPRFPPGTDWSYQSSGILLASTIAERLTGLTMKDLLHERLFGPLGLRSSVLGMREGYERRVVEARGGKDHPEHGWNSLYWRRLGAPWGGLHSTADELAVVLQTMLNGGSYGDLDVLSPAVAEAAVACQTDRLPELPEAVRRRHRWGFGWQLAGPDNAMAWPQLVSERAFGHTGATGTIFWADPVSEMVVVLLTNCGGAASGALRSEVMSMVACAWR